MIAKFFTLDHVDVGCSHHVTLQLYSLAHATVCRVRLHLAWSGKKSKPAQVDENLESCKSFKAFPGFHLVQPLGNSCTKDVGVRN